MNNFPEIHSSNAGSSAPKDLMLFEAAISSMPCGFSLWDENLNLALFNQNYLDIYQLTSVKLVRGISLSDLIEIRIEEGSMPGVEHAEAYEKIRREFLDHQDPNNHIIVEKHVLGRTIKVAVARHPGVGWVVTYEDITKINQRVQMRKVREVELELQNSRFEAAVENMPSGLSMYDRDKKLVICNSKYVELYGLPDHLSIPGTDFEKIVEFRKNSGLLHRDGIEVHKALFEKSLQEEISGSTVFELANGMSYSIIHRLMADGGWVSIHDDVSDEMEKLRAARAREDELTLQNARFEAAVGNMAHGLAMFDAEEKLVICNQPYLEIYGLPSEMGHPGTQFQDILNFRLSLPNAPLVADQGELPKKIKALASSMDLGGAPVKKIWEMQNGQHVSSTYGPTGDGGWVSTHEDVTSERHRVKAAKLREVELKVQNYRFDAAVQNMAHGLAMFDRDENLVICNQPYLEIYGLPPEYGKPGTSMKSMLVFREKAGAIPKDLDQNGIAISLMELIRDLKPGSEPVKKIWELQNGQHISVSYGPMEDGGWVSTHEDVTKRQKEEAHIKHLSRHDALTGLANRIYFAEELAKAESRMAREEKMAVLCLDLDRFKDINDTLGHGIGDEVLKQVGVRLKNAAREHELVARMGGDEFTLLVGPLEKAQQASLVAQRIFDEFSTPLSVEGHQIKIGTSIGIAVSPTDGLEGAILLKNADRALYRAKDDGKGCFRFFEQGMDNSVRHRRNMEEDLRGALAKDQFFLTFQPILELASKRISACEVLVNWNHPRLGHLLSGDFVQLAGEIGINDELLRWTIEQACCEATSWPSQVRLSINLSTLQVDNKGLVDAVGKALGKSGLDPARLELGVSEAHLESRPSQSVKILHELRLLGIRLSLDEFGKNSSSLNRLKIFSFDKINLDATFVADNSANPENREIARAVVGLGRSLGIVMNASGVEKECQLDFMRELGCHEVQGYLFSAALPTHSIGELLRTVELRAAEELGILPSMSVDRVMDL